MRAVARPGLAWGCSLWSVAGVLPILHANEGFLVVDKPAGIAVHGGDGEDVLSLLGKAFPGEPLAPAHRLDAETSGCLLVARTKTVLLGLARAFAERRVVKSYLAVVAGRLPDQEGEVFTHIAPAGPGTPRMVVVEPGAGPAALTVFRVLRAGDDRSLVEVRPITGRTHQIRVHLRHLGHPILGDPLYAFPGAPPAPRLMLHAWKLAFPHPSNKELIPIEAAPDPAFGLR